MRHLAPTRPFALVLLVVSALTVWAVVGFGSGTPVHADDSGPLVATSICEAHELRALAEEQPDLKIEIPKEFDTPWPSREACISYELADDPEAPGPLQPIPFSHKHHAGLYEIECMYCHAGTDRSRAAGVPSVELCMGCHAQFPAAYDKEFEGIRTLKEHWESGEPIEWVQLHRLPEHVKFQHRAHVRAGFECQECHGNVEEMDKLYVTEDTIWWPWGLPAAKLEMGWCIDCHRNNGASQDCLVCHY